MSAAPTLSQIRIDGGTQPRVAIAEDVVAEYTEALREGATFPPLIAFFDGADYWLADGFHRYHAHRAAGTVPAVDVRQGTRRDAVLYSVGANGAHGLRRSNEDKRKAVSTLLADPEWAAWSDSEIARRCAVSHPFVGQIRRSLTCNVTSEAAPVASASVADSASDPPPAARRVVTKHGTEALMDTSRIGRKQPAQDIAEQPAPATVEPERQAAVNEPVVRLVPASKPSEPDKQKARIAELESALQDARDAAEAAGALAQDLTAIADGDAAKRMAQLEAELRAVKVVRDQYMRENAQLKRQIKALERKLGAAA